MALTESTREISDQPRLVANPLVSVYMATFNHQQYIGEAIEGVVAQKTTFPFELIIGEDCSTDGTRNIIYSYQGRFPELIRVITSDRNVGMIENANRCLPRARGDYIAFCEGDDYWQNPDKLEMQVRLMESCPDMTLCHTDYDRQIGKRVERSVHSKRAVNRIARGEAYVDLLHSWTVKTATALYRADVIMDFMETEFNKAEWPFGDYNKLLYASVRGRVGYIPNSTATWRMVPGSATNAGYDRWLSIGLAYAECRELFMNRYPVPEEVRTSVRCESCQRILRRAFYAGNIKLFDRHLARLEKLGCDASRLKYSVARKVMSSSFGLAVARLNRRLKMVDLSLGILDWLGRSLDRRQG